jgi:voltage-gated potassium channel Kch
VPVTLIDLEPRMIEVSGEFGTKVYYGDGLRLELLQTAGADSARAILFCIDGSAANRETMQRVLDAFPQASIMVRAYDRRHLIDLRGLDIAVAQRELFESAVKMGRAALRAVGVEASEVDRVEEEYRLRDCERLERQAEAGNLKAGIDRMFAVDNPLPDSGEA